MEEAKRQTELEKKRLTAERKKQEEETAKIRQETEEEQRRLAAERKKQEEEIAKARQKAEANRIAAEEARKKNQLRIQQQNVSAISLADKWFAEGNYSGANEWWELLCEAIDEIYYRKTNTRTATTQREKAIWLGIRDTTAGEFYKDRQRKGDNSWSKNRVINKINESCK